MYQNEPGGLFDDSMDQNLNKLANGAQITVVSGKKQKEFIFLKVRALILVKYWQNLHFLDNLMDRTTSKDCTRRIFEV